MFIEHPLRFRLLALIYSTHFQGFCRPQGQLTPVVLMPYPYSTRLSFSSEEKT